MGLVIEALSDANAGEWDDLVRTSPDGWSFSLAGWQRLILNVSEWGLVDHSFAVREGAKLVAVMPLQYRPDHKTMGSTGWGGSGPAIAAERTEAARAHLFSHAVAEARTRARAAGADRLEMSCSPVTRASLSNRWGINPFVLEGFSETPRISQVIEMKSGEEQLWAGLSKSARQAVRAAAKAGYTSRRVEWAEYLDAYYDVHCETYRRDGLRPHPKAYFSGIAEEIAPQGAAVLFAAFDKNGEAVAFHNDSRFGLGAYYHTGCSRDAVRDAGVSYLLFWRAMRDASASGALWYDAGWIFPNSEDQKQHGLTLFKTRFGGEPHRAFTSHIEFTRPPLQGISPPPSELTEKVKATPTSPVNSTRQAYEAEGVYKTDTICARASRDAPEYVHRLLFEKLALILKYKQEGLLVDLCCATGEHLFEIADPAFVNVGIDFSLPFLARANTDARKVSAVTFLAGDARRLPLRDASVGTIYSLSSLYQVEGLNQVFAEISRVLRPGGRCILDLGNARSLNAICIGHYPELPRSFLWRPAQMRQFATSNGLRVIEDRAFQILPLWAGKPQWMWILLHPFWKKVMAARIGGRMLDDWLSNFPLLKPFAFRHLLVCEKV